jgi:hypothetical protein
MFDYLPIPLFACRLSWLAMSRLQTTLPEDANLGRLMAYARAGSQTVLAQDGARLIGFRFLAPDIYFISDFPSQVRLGDVVQVAGIAVLLAFFIDGLPGMARRRDRAGRSVAT